MESECVPARKKNGEIAKGGNTYKIMWKALEGREGPRPFQKAICRHLCKNDSTAPNGFVCVLHTTWGTLSQNMMDRSAQCRTQSASKAGKIGGKISGKIVGNRPDQPQKLQVTCPHCGKTGTMRPMMRWHFDRCRHKPDSV
jgi:hypothetical protein